MIEIKIIMGYAAKASPIVAVAFFAVYVVTGRRWAFYLTAITLFSMMFLFSLEKLSTWVALEASLALLFTYLVYARVERYNRKVVRHNTTLAPGAVSMGNCSIWRAVTYTLRAHFYWLAPVAGLCLYI